MRLNRGTIILLVVGLIVIGAVLVINNQQANAPAAPTATPQPGAGPILADITAADITGLQVRNNDTGAYTALARAADGTWAVDATLRTDRAVDQAAAQDAINRAGSLASVDRFESGDLAQFGLDTPRFTVYIETANGAYYIHVGDQNPFNRTYLVVQTQDVTPFDPEVTPDPDAPTAEPEATAEAAAEATAEATPEATAEATPEVAPVAIETSAPEPTPQTLVTLSGTQLIYTIIAANINDLTTLVDTPPYVPPPTATPTATNTPNPYSEVEMTATAQAVFDQLQMTATAQALPEATVEVTEAMPMSTPAVEEPTAQPTEAAPAEVTEEPTSAPTATLTNTATATHTPVPPTATPTNTATATHTPVPPTATSTNTATATHTPVPPTATPTNTATATRTPVPPTATSTNTATATHT
ncbi:MAG: DUF4340 domain-containing protein, partial [Candidatus Flexifilum sp.]